MNEKKNNVSGKVDLFQTKDYVLRNCFHPVYLEGVSCTDSPRPVGPNPNPARGSILTGP